MTDMLFHCDPPMHVWLFIVSWRSLALYSAAAKEERGKKRRKFPTDKASTYSLENETDPFYVTIFNFENFMIACKINSFSYQKISINGTR